MKFYHGSEVEIKEFKNGCIYVSKSIDVAKEYALADSEIGFIYEVEIEENEIEIEEDFEFFDCGGYTNPNSWDATVVYNEEKQYAFIKNAAERTFVLIEKL